MPMSKRAMAEFFGTFWLVCGGCGAAVLAAGVPSVGIGYAGVALASGGAESLQAGCSTSSRAATSASTFTTDSR
jgi:glycerol uptake facilitator-like aquaporin